MSISRIFSIIGDSNVRQNMTPFNVRDRPGLSDAQLLAASRLDVLPDALRSVRGTSNVVIIACLTNFLTSSEEASSISGRISPVMSEFRQHLDAFCSSRQSTQVMVAPPMYRVRPHWYSVGLPEILIEFSSVISAQRPPNLHLLDSFPTPELQADGVHLTAYSGLRFIVHLFDNARALAEAPTPTPEGSRTAEAVRVVADRVGVLEQGHARLAAAFDMKTAVDAELDDYLENQKYEDHFTIAGLDGPESGLTSRDWQQQVKRQVQVKIQLILRRQASISYIQNITGKRGNGIKVFLVKMDNLVDAKMIRDKFGSYFKAGAAVRPSGLLGLSIRNRVTVGTRIRIEIMKLLADRYKKSNPGSKTQVVNYEPRPTMKFTPPSSATDTRPLHFTFIKAVTKLPVDFTLEELTPIYRLAASSSELTGKLRSTFIVLSDDVARELSRNASRATASAASEAGPHSEPALPSATSESAMDQDPPVDQHGARGSRGGRGGRPPRSSRSSQVEHDRSRSRSPLRGPTVS